MLNLIEFLSIIKYFGGKGTEKDVTFTKLYFQAFKKVFTCNYLKFECWPSVHCCELHTSENVTKPYEKHFLELAQGVRIMAAAEGNTSVFNWYFGIILRGCARFYKHIKWNTLIFFPAAIPSKIFWIVNEEDNLYISNFQAKIFSGVCSVWKKPSLLCADKVFYLSRQSDRGDPPVQELVTFTFCWISQCHFSQAGTIPSRDEDSYHKNLHGNKFLFWYWEGSEIIWPSCFRICHLVEKCHIVDPTFAEMVANGKGRSPSGSAWPQLQGVLGWSI